MSAMPKDEMRQWSTRGKEGEKRWLELDLDDCLLDFDLSTCLNTSSV
jgi:hypothetical protein